MSADRIRHGIALRRCADMTASVNFRRSVRGFTNCSSTTSRLASVANLTVQLVIGDVAPHDYLFLLTSFIIVVNSKDGPAERCDGTSQWTRPIGAIAVTRLATSASALCLGARRLAPAGAGAIRLDSCGSARQGLLRRRRPAGAGQPDIGAGQTPIRVRFNPWPRPAGLTMRRSRPTQPRRRRVRA